MDHPQFESDLHEFANNNNFQLIETHISWILISTPSSPSATFNRAYKLKKPVNFGFLDYSTLERRKHFCEEELRLNRRLAPELYLSVVPFSKSKDGLSIGGNENIVEYAVEMEKFDGTQELSELLKEQRITIDDSEALAKQIAWAHSGATRLNEVASSKDEKLGTPASVAEAVENNFAIVAQHIKEQDQSLLNQLRSWVDKKHQELSPLMSSRLSQGFVRECHGDLHSGNIVLHEGKFLLFDCIEFNDDFRWIDIQSEIAFILMDLEDKGFPELSNHLLNRYLDLSGDFSGLLLLDYYKAYRAMVRAKVLMLRQDQVDRTEQAAEKDSIYQQALHYVRLAFSYTEDKSPELLLMHGFSGSGKSTIANKLLALAPYIHLRSDVERKRLFELAPNQSSDSGIDSGIYSKEASIRTFQRLEELSEQCLKAGFPVIVDATFLKSSFRMPFQSVANKQGVPYRILDCVAPIEELKARINKRASTQKDASEATVEVLELQLAEADGFDDGENAIVVTIDTTREISAEFLATAIGRS